LPCGQALLSACVKPFTVLHLAVRPCSRPTAGLDTSPCSQMRRSTASTHHPCPTLRSGYDSGQLPPHGQPSGDDDTRVGILIDVLRLPALRLVDTVCQSRAPLQANLLDALHGSRQRLLRDLIRKRVVRSTPTAFQTNPEHSRPLCDTVLQQHPIGHHGAMMANHHTTLPGSPTKEPRRIRTTPKGRPVWTATDTVDAPALQTSPDGVKPLCDTVLRRHPIGHHRAPMASHRTTPPGSPTENPKIRPTPEGRPVWAATDLDDQAIQC